MFAEQSEHGIHSDSDSLQSLQRQESTETQLDHRHSCDGGLNMVRVQSRILTSTGAAVSVSLLHLSKLKARRDGRRPSQRAILKHSLKRTLNSQEKLIRSLFEGLEAIGISNSKKQSIYQKFQNFSTNVSFTDIIGPAIENNKYSNVQ